MIRVFQLLILLFISSCSLSPFNSNTSGRSYGRGRVQAEMGNVNNNYFLKAGFGASKDLDVGYQMEFGKLGTSGIFMKYSLVNKPTGFAWAVELDYGANADTSYYSVGQILSYAFGKSSELFVNSKLSSVSGDESTYDLNYDYGPFKILEDNFTYYQIAYGINVWINPLVGLALYNTYFDGDESIEPTYTQVFGANILLKL